MTSPDTLLAQIPEFVDTVWRTAPRSTADVSATATAAGLEADRVHESADTYVWDFVLDPPSPSFGRAIRSAVTRRVGRTAGTDKHWDLDAFVATLTTRDTRLSLHLRRQYPLERMRAAASSWLAGADSRSWATEFGFAREDGARTPGRYLHLEDDRPRAASASLSAGQHPDGTFPTSDDESYSLTVEYFAEVLGPPGPGTTAISPLWWAWRGNDRVVDLRPMRSRARWVRYFEEGDDPDPGT